VTHPSGPDGRENDGREDDGREEDGRDDVDGPFADTTVRRPRVPPPPDAVALAETDHAHDTVIAQRGRRDHSAGERQHKAPVETHVGGVAAYASRVAAPVRGSRKLGTAPGEPTAAVPDASEIRRAVRGRARRRFVAVVATIIGLVVVLSGALIALVFAVGV